jgi:hypothetical protein
MIVENAMIIAPAVSKISALVKKRAINFLSDKPVSALDLELTEILMQVWNNGYDSGIDAGQKIKEL